MKIFVLAFLSLLGTSALAGGGPGDLDEILNEENQKFLKIHGNVSLKRIPEPHKSRASKLVTLMLHDFEWKEFLPFHANKEEEKEGSSYDPAARFQAYLKDYADEIVDKAFPLNPHELIAALSFARDISSIINQDGENKNEILADARLEIGGDPRMIRFAIALRQLSRAVAEQISQKFDMGANEALRGIYSKLFEIFLSQKPSEEDYCKILPPLVINPPLAIYASPQSPVQFIFQPAAL